MIASTSTNSKTLKPLRRRNDIESERAAIPRKRTSIEIIDLETIALNAQAGGRDE